MRSRRQRSSEICVVLCATSSRTRSADSISVPLLAIENSADDAVPQPHARIIHDAAASKDKTFRVVKGATHYYQGQPELLKQAVELCVGWLQERKLF